MEVDPWLDKWGRRVCEHPKFWKRLARFETRLLADRLEGVERGPPIFITGMARSGSTILLEILNQHPATKSFCYQDFPFVQIPWFWSQFLNCSKRSHIPEERAHKDRILITPQSPEAMEEMLWMGAFPNLHEENVSHLKDHNFQNQEFSTYYTSTIQKLLLTYDAGCYLCKGNYNITRIGYLLKIFPDARFVIPIRHPVSHIASSIKQHRLFCEQQDPKVSAHLQRVGHFEFGPARTAINTGNPTDSQEINTLWQKNEDIAGYALQWKLLYDYVVTLLPHPSILLIRFEDLCEDSPAQLRKLFDHAQLADAEQIVDKYREHLKPPEYYNHNFTDEELKIISEHTGKTASKFSY